MSTPSTLFYTLLCVIFVAMAQVSRPMPWRLLVGPIRAEAPRVIYAADGFAQTGVGVALLTFAESAPLRS